MVASSELLVLTPACSFILCKPQAFLLASVFCSLPPVAVGLRAGQTGCTDCPLDFRVDSQSHVGEKHLYTHKRITDLLFCLQCHTPPVLLWLGQSVHGAILYCNFFTVNRRMAKTVTFLLLCSFGLASTLGHGGFHILGLHSHCGAQHTAFATSHTNGNHTDHHSHHEHAHHTNFFTGLEDSCHHSQHQTPSPPLVPKDHSEDCVICQFLGLTKAHIVHTPIWHCVSATVPHLLVVKNDILLSFDFSLRPCPRGPPAIFA